VARPTLSVRFSTAPSEWPTKSRKVCEVDVNGIATDRIERLSAVENERFVRERPRSKARLEQARRTMPRGVPMAWMDDLYEHPPVWITHGEGAYFSDVDGHEYLDLYIADMSAFCGHAPAAVVAAVDERMRRGNQFLLPSEDAIPVAEHLGERYGLPKWQFTLSATQANTEIIRIARQATGREVVLVFDGKYHGMLDTTLLVVEEGRVVPEYEGLPRGLERTTRIVPFNDPEALERALAPSDVAIVLSEPALTNAGLIPPKPGFHNALRQATAETGTLLAIDETHTLVTAYAGLTNAWGLNPDFITLGKSIAAGVPLGAYGMTDELAALLAAPDESYVVSGVSTGEIATGGTLFANALSLAAGRSALMEVLTQEAFERTAMLGARLAAGVRTAIASHGLPWSVTHEGSHAYYSFAPEPPHDGASSRAADDPALRALIRIFMANRGVWESGWWLGPTVSVAHAEADVDRYLELFDELLAAIAD
jgi:glutamate-1-semialdehyde 2,1-aminomutase